MYAFPVAHISPSAVTYTLIGITTSGFFLFLRKTLASKAFSKKASHLIGDQKQY